MEKTDNWKAFGSKYLKAEDVTNNTDKYAIISVTSQNENDRETIILTLERNGIQKLFGCNATNEQAVKMACPDSPKQSIGKVVTFNKVKVTNPNTKQIVDGLRIAFNQIKTEDYI
jgi:hypothetical protein